MKSIFYTSLVFCTMVMAQSAFAQDATSSSGSYGDFRVYAGLNNISGGGFSDAINGILHNHTVEGQLGYAIGISGTFGNHFYLAPGLYYASNVAETTATSDIPGAASFKGKSTINSINLPIRVGYRMLDVNHSGAFNLRLFGGVLGSHVLGVSHKGDDQVALDKDDFTNFNISGQAGFGLDIFIAFIDIGYDLGLTDFSTEDGVQKQNQFFINAGIRF